MKPIQLLGIALIAGAAILLYFGINAARSPVEEIGEALTGRYSDETMTYLIGGGVAGIVGLFLLLRGR